MLKKRSLLRIPLHQRIADDLRKELEGLPVGSKIPPEPELAARYDVSVPTLRMAITILAQEGLVDRKHGSGTYIEEKRPSVGRRTPGSRRVVGVPMPIKKFGESCLMEFWFQQMNMLLSGMDELGIEFQLLPAREVDGMFSPECGQFIQSPEAVALLVTCFVPQAVLDAAQERGLPCLGTDVLSREKLVLWTGIDYSNMVSKAAEFFKMRGCKRVAMLAWSETECMPGGDSPSIRMLKRAVEECGLITRERWLCTDLHPRERAAGWSGLREIWSASPQKPDALLVADSKLLPGVLEAARDLKIRVPEDLYIISHSNVPESATFPPQVAKMEYLISDWVEPLLDGLQRIIHGEALERKVIEVSASLISAEMEHDDARSSVTGESSLTL